MRIEGARRVRVRVLRVWPCGCDESSNLYLCRRCPMFTGYVLQKCRTYRTEPQNRRTSRVQVLVHSNILVLRNSGDQPVRPIKHSRLEIRIERVGLRSVSLILLLVHKEKWGTTHK